MTVRGSRRRNTKCGGILYQCENYGHEVELQVTAKSNSQHDPVQKKTKVNDRSSIYALVLNQTINFSGCVLPKFSGSLIVELMILVHPVTIK
jgi:hypothetical protein